jgi:hypothetical protein
MAANDENHPVTSLFGSDLPIGTGAPGTPGITAAMDAGPVVGVVTVSDGWASSQVPSNLPTRPVRAGDTSAYSSDYPTPQNPLLPVNTGTSSVGPHTGSGHQPHPNAGQ